MIKLIKKLIVKIENAYPAYIITILFVIGLLLYARSLFNGFVWDDNYQILSNTIIQNPLNIFSLFRGSTFNGGGLPALVGIYYKPLMSLSYLINYALWGPNPFFFHLTNVVFHIINTLLLFLLFRKLFQKENIPFSQCISFIASLIFLIHPANVEVVAFIGSLQEELYVFFILFSLILLFFGSHDHISKKKIFFIHLLVLLSLLSKETGVIGVFLILIASRFFYRKQFINFLWSSCFIMVVYLFLRLFIASIPFLAKQAAIPIQITPFPIRLLNIPYEVVSYARMFFYPKDLYIYQDDIVRGIKDEKFLTTFPFFLFIFIMFFAFPWIKKVRSKVFIFFYLWIILGFGMILNIIPLDMTIAERWMYGPMIGLLGLLSLLYIRLFYRYRVVLTISFLLLIAILPFLALRTYIRIGDWYSNKSLYEHDIQYEKSSNALWNSYGSMLAQDGKFDQAINAFKKSIQLYPLQSEAYDNLGVIYYNQNKLSLAKFYFSIAVVHAEGYIIYQNYGKLLVQTHDPITIHFLKSALSIYSNNDILTEELAQAYADEGNKKLANIYAQRAYQLNPLPTYLYFLKKLGNSSNNSIN